MAVFWSWQLFRSCKLWCHCCILDVPDSWLTFFCGSILPLARVWFTHIISHIWVYQTSKNPSYQINWQFMSWQDLNLTVWHRACFLNLGEKHSTDSTVTPVRKRWCGNGSILEQSTSYVLMASTSCSYIIRLGPARKASLPSFCRFSYGNHMFLSVSSLSWSLSLLFGQSSALAKTYPLSFQHPAGLRPAEAEARARIFRKMQMHHLTIVIRIVIIS